MARTRIKSKNVQKWKKLSRIDKPVGKWHKRTNHLEEVKQGAQ